MMKPKFNWMDFVILIVCVAVLGGGIWMLRSMTAGDGGGATAAGNVKVTYKIEVNNKVESYTTLAKPGDSVTVGDKEKLAAVVKDIEVKPYERVGYNTLDGSAAWEEVPERYTVIYTLESDGTDTESAVTVNNTALRVGGATTVNGKGYAGYGYIISVETSE